MENIFQIRHSYLGMKYLYQYFFFVLLFVYSTFPTRAQEPPASEIRAVWLTTNWNLDWPSSPNISAKQQQSELRSILDKLKDANFNTILFQVRVRGDVFYKSNIEPWSSFFQKNTSIGGASAYDPLSFAIEECHKRGLECHAWFVTFPVGTQKQVKYRKNNSIAFRRPDLCKLHNGEWYLDPGNPQARSYIISLVDELISNYDVDGIHFDYIRYPEAASKFPDKDTFAKYGKGKSLNEWRRDNITELVTDIYDLVKANKPWVQVSSSPVGRYRDLNPMRGKWTAYGSVHQDAGAWLLKGKMDAVYPMLYYNEVDFKDHVDDWKLNSNERFIVPGLGVYRMLKNEGDWSLSDIENQVNTSNSSQISGHAFYRAGNVLDNVKGIYDMLKEGPYALPAKIPPMKWMDNVAPNSPADLQVYRNDKGLVTIEWKSSNPNEDQIYTVYESDTEEFDINKAKDIVATGIRGNKVYLDIPYSDFGVYFSVTASDRYHNESVPCFPVFFIPSSTFEK